MSKKLHYHVLGGLQGLYMPDSNTVCSCLEEAHECAAEEAADWGEAHEAEVTRLSADCYQIGDHWIVEVVSCDQVDCEKDLDE